MKCLYCGCLESRVIDSRPTDEGLSIRRRRECSQCGKRFTTYEKIEELPIVVIKKDGRREPFDSSKVLDGVRKACEKRPITMAQIEKIVDGVVREAFNSLDQEVSSSGIGEMVMRRLKDVDEVAYVRFASVYRSFRDVNTFFEELKSLMGEKPGEDKSDAKE